MLKSTWKGAKRMWRAYQRYKYERWARPFAARWDLPFEGVMLMAGYKVKESKGVRTDARRGTGSKTRSDTGS